MATTTTLENQMFELLSNCDKLFFVGTLADGCCRWSAQATLQFPLTPEEASGQNPTLWGHLVHGEDLSVFLQALEELSTGGRQNLHGEYRLCTRDEGWIWTQVHIWALPPGDGPLTFAGTAENLMIQDTFDPITRLPSNYDFRAALEEISRQTEAWGILILGLDAFKRVIDLHSYTFGDDVLRTFARKLQLHLPADARLYRLDGDGFGILWPGKTREDMSTLYDHLTQIAHQPLWAQSTEVNLTFSGAACQYPTDSNSGDGLFRCARMALSAAKQGGGNQFVPYTEEISRLARRELLLMEKLRESVYQNYAGFYLNYQPLVLAEVEELYGCEVLLRWENTAFPDGVTPYEFIPALERIGLMSKVGGWVLQEAVAQCAKWTKLMPNFQMSINVTSTQFEDPEFRFFVMDCLTRSKLSPTLITLELTESNSISNTEAVGHAFDFFRSQGIKIAFDDFGMGYASLDIFRMLSADELKIDRSFLERLSYDVTDQKIITHLINLCHSMNISVCVEGVETPEVVRILQQLGPKLFQGYYYNRPMSAEAFEAFYLQKRESLAKLPILPPLPILQKGLMGEETLRPVQPLGMDELVEGVHAGIFQVAIDEHFTFLSCNEGYRRMLGYTARQIEELFENRALAFVHPDDAEQLSSQIQYQLGMGDNIHCEFRIVRSDGSPLWVVGTGNVVKSRDGTPSLAVIIIDVSAQKRQSLLLEADYHKYRKILENIPGGVKCVRHDQYFTLEYISPSFLSLLGYNEQDIRERFDGKYVNMVVPEDVPKVLDSITTQIESGASVLTLRYRSLCKDGRIIWLETITRLCPPDPDGIQRYYSSVVDITESVVGPTGQHRSQSLAQRHRDTDPCRENICFTYDCLRDSANFSANFQQVLGRRPYPTLAEEIAQLHPDDQQKLGASLEQLLAGELCPPVAVRLVISGHSYLWISIQFDAPQPEGDTSTVTGRISVLDEEESRGEPDYTPQCDPLTGLLNRRALEETIRAQLMAQTNCNYALYLVDINNLKQINYQYGHPFGNQVLRELSQRIQHQMGNGVVLGRTGGDEFIAFLPISSQESPKALGEALLHKICGGYAFEGILAKVSACVGVACVPEDGNQFYELYRRAQAALYRAKARGGSQCVTFSHTGGDYQ